LQDGAITASLDHESLLAFNLYPKTGREMKIRHYDQLIVVFALTLAALATHAYGLSKWNLIGDEYYTIFRAPERYTSLVNPAGYALVLASIKIFGLSEWSARLPSFLLGILTIPVFYLTWKQVVGKNAALFGAAITIASNWHLEWSQYARFYTGVFLFGSLSYYFYYVAIKEGRLSYLGGALFANLCAFLFHATAIFAPAACGAFSLLLLLLPETGVRYSRRIATIHLLILAAAVVALFPLLWGVLSGWQVNGQDYGYKPIRLMLQLIKYIQVPVAIAAAFGLLLLLKQEIIKGIFFAVGVGIPVTALLIGSGIMYVRPDYVFYAIPLVYLLAGVFCEGTRQALAAQGRLASMGVASVVIISMLPAFVSYYSGKISLDFRQAVQFVEQSFRLGDKIIVFENDFRYYAAKSYPIEPYPGYPYSDNVDWKHALQKYCNTDFRVWFILPVRRIPLARGLEAWLLDNASLAWRRYETRYDYTVRGYQIFVTNKVPGSSPACAKS
jgi:4-amino-4-deoxy-L-arabinose transferase-like glycosyltransferase